MTPNHLTKTGVLYCRVSSTDQVEGTSLDTQERACRDFAQKQGITILETFIERGESAKTANRTELNRAVTFCKRRKVGFFIVYKIDRFARNQDDHVTVRAYLRRSGTELRSVTEPIDDTPIGRAMEGVLSVFAEFDNNVRTERSKQGMLERVRQGVWVWPAPPGYFRPHEGANLVPDPKVAPLILHAFEEFSTGTHTYARLAAHLAELGLRTRYGRMPTASWIFKILSNPVYTGTIRTGGEEYVGSFEPIVSRQLFFACQPKNLRSAAPHAQPRSLNNPEFPLRGVVQCAKCGKSLTGSTSTGSKGGRYAYYHHYQPLCPIARAIPKGDLENHWLVFLERFTIRPELRSLLRESLHDLSQRFVTSQAEHTARVRKELTELEAARQKVFELHRRGIYTDDEFTEQRRLADERIKQKHLSLTDRHGSDEDWVAGLECCLEALAEPVQTWRTLNSDFPKQLRFQQLLVPKGLTFDGEGFGTHELSLIYEMKEGVQDPRFRLEPLLTHRWNDVRCELKQWRELGTRGPS